MRIGDMTPEELKALIGEVVEEKLKSLLFDPDLDYVLKEEIEARLKASMASTERFSLEEVGKKLGLT
jgi:hypothetical protein